MVKPKVVLLIFVSGKIVLTGAKVSVVDSRSHLALPLPGQIANPRLLFSSPSGKVREEIYQAFNLIFPVLSEYRKN